MDDIQLGKLKEQLPPVKSNIYVDVDSLFDTRLSTLYMLNDATAEELVTTGKYYDRVRDNFGSISADIFYTLYSRRNTEPLKLGIPTPIIDLVTEHYGSIVTDIKNIEKEEDLKIYLNIYPYRLEEEEIDVICRYIENYIPDVILEVIYKSIEDLTPRWIVDHVGCMFMYEANKWLEYHNGTSGIYTVPLLNIMLFAPALITGSSRDLTINKEYFKSLEEKMSLCIDYNLIDARYFSAKPIRIEEESKEDNKKEI